MHLVSGGMEQRVCNSAEAMAAFDRWSYLLTEDQRARLLAASLSKDGEDWLLSCPLSGTGSLELFGTINREGIIR